MRRLTKTVLTTVSASALAVGLASPALADNDVRYYYENDHDYTVEFNFSVYEAPLRSDSDYPETGGVIAPLMSTTDDKCLKGFGHTPEHPVHELRRVDGIRVDPGVHEYLCWTVVPRGSGVSAMIGDTKVTTPSGAVYSLQADGKAADMFYYDTRIGYMEFNKMGYAPFNQPEWLRYLRKKPEWNSYNLTIQMLWEAPVEQEAQLANLMDVTPDDCTIVGTPGDDVLVGTDGDDVICGLGADDTIYAGDGDDTVKGGSGDDTIYGGDGDDTLGGGSGDDRVDGGSGDDAMHGATGEDILVGGEGDDLTDGGSGDDALLPDDSDAAEQSSDVNDLAATDSTGNIVEEGDGDGATAQEFGASEDDEAFREWVENCTFGPGGNC